MFLEKYIPNRFKRKEQPLNHEVDFKNDSLLGTLKGADPASGPEFDNWAKSPAGEETFKRVLARRDEPTPQRKGVIKRALGKIGLNRQTKA
jgi:hypothetical protein